MLMAFVTSASFVCCLWCCEYG